MTENNFAMVECLVSDSRPVDGQKVLLYTKSGILISNEHGVFMQYSLPDIVRWSGRFFIREGDSNSYIEGNICTASFIVPS